MSNSSPAVSVVIPTYKHSQTVLTTLESVFAQTYTDYEVIVINDGSPDDTAAVLHPLKEQGKILYVEQPNAGQSSARNRGLSLARGRYIALLDDDDLWPPDKLAWQVETFLQEPEAVLVYGYMTMFGEADNSFPKSNAPAGEVFDAFLRYNWIRSPGQTLIQRDALRAVSGFDATIWGADDWDLYLRLAKIGRFAFRDRCALLYRYHSQSASRDTKRMHQNALRVVFKHVGRFPQPRNLLTWWRGVGFVQRMAATDYGDECERLMAGGHYLPARRACISALKAWPFLLYRRHFIQMVLRAVLPVFDRTMRKRRRVK